MNFVFACFLVLSSFIYLDCHSAEAFDEPCFIIASRQKDAIKEINQTHYLDPRYNYLIGRILGYQDCLYILQPTVWNPEIFTTEYILPSTLTYSSSRDPSLHRPSECVYNIGHRIIGSVP